MKSKKKFNNGLACGLCAHLFLNRRQVIAERRPRPQISVPNMYTCMHMYNMYTCTYMFCFGIHVCTLWAFAFLSGGTHVICEPFLSCSHCGLYIMKLYYTLDWHTHQHTGCSPVETTYPSSVSTSVSAHLSFRASTAQRVCSLLHFSPKTSVIRQSCCFFK